VSIDRRKFLAGAALGTGGLVAALSPLKDLEGQSLDAWLQSHFREMDAEEKKEVLERLEAEAKEEYGVEIKIKDLPAREKTRFGYALNLGVCVGCRRCAYACQKENNVSRRPGMQYIRVLEMEKGGFNLENSDHQYNPELVPEPGHFYMPVQCHQCSEAPCTRVCPVKATWIEDDGIIVVDYNWCIGCRYCEAACPYWARRFNFAKPSLPKEEINPNTAYLSNRPRSVGVIEKCTFCLHRTREGRYPACLEACPTGARAFGNLLDPKSEIRYILKEKRVFLLKEELGAEPNFFYYLDA